MEDTAYLRAVARYCRELSEECFDLTVAGKLRRLSESIEAKAREPERGRGARNAMSSWAALGRWLRQRRPFARLRARNRISTAQRHAARARAG